MLRTDDFDMVNKGVQSLLVYMPTLADLPVTSAIDKGLQASITVGMVLSVCQTPCSLCAVKYVLGSEMSFTQKTCINRFPKGGYDAVAPGGPIE